VAWTWEAIERDALKESGVLGRGQIVTASLYEEASDQLMRLLDYLDGEGLALPAFTHDFTFLTVASQTKYFLGTGTETAAFPLRPESIEAVTITVSPSPNPTNQRLSFVPFATYKGDISNPENGGQPYNYSINERWPQSEFYLYPNPTQAWPINVTAKLRWVDTVGSPAVNPFAVAQVPSGYTNALVMLLAYRLARKNRLLTQELKDANRDAMASIGAQVNSQTSWGSEQAPIVYPWTILQTRQNP
jgi:hypothetical protein